MINLRSARARRNEVSTQNRVRTALERVLKKQMQNALNEMGKAATQAYKKGGELKALVATHEVEKYIAKLLQSSYARAITVSTARIQARLSGKSMETVLENKSDAEDLLTDEELTTIIRDYARANAAEKAKGIGETTRTRIQRAVAQGSKEGLSTQEIAALIEEKTYGVINDYRAEMIARTETHAALQYGSIEAARSTELIQTKTWLSGSDPRTRDDHTEMDGQTVGIDEEFSGPCAGMQFPGDPNGPPEQVINCRCVLLYNTEG